MSSFAIGSSEQRVNSYIAKDQAGLSVTTLLDGGWIATWHSNGQDSGYYGVYQQRYDAAGALVGSETRVSTYVRASQYIASTAALADGGWIVVWNSFNQDGDINNVYQQRYTADGSVLGGKTRVNTYTQGDQHSLDLQALRDGGWVVTYGGDGPNGSGTYQKIYDADGVALSSTDTWMSVSQTTFLASGGKVETWYSSADKSYVSRAYDVDGTALGKPVIFDKGRTAFNCQIETLADGGWVAVWYSYSSESSNTGEKYLRFGADGAAIGEAALVSNAPLDSGVVTGLSDGGWVVAWQDYSELDGSGSGIFQQRYSADGVKIGGQTQVNVYTSGDQVDPSIDATPDGGWVVSWTCRDQDGLGSGVYQRHFAPDILGGVAADSLVGTSWDETLQGRGGNDTLNGGGGNDILLGGFGNDVYVINSVGDKAQELPNQGVDTIRSSITLTLPGAIENLVLTGSGNINGTGNSLANAIKGNAGANALNGGSGNDSLGGEAGLDVLTGGSGNDWLDGGAGIDRLYGGGGADLFVFEAGDTGATADTADILYDFSSTQLDKIDLHLIDANTKLAGDQALTFIGSAGFHKTAGELRFVQTSVATTVSADLNGDGKADLVLKLDTSVALHASDFSL